MLAALCTICLLWLQHSLLHHAWSCTSEELRTQRHGCLWPLAQQLAAAPPCSRRSPPAQPLVLLPPAGLPFLVRGGYTSSQGTLVAGLDPFPSNVVPATSCAAPTVTIPTSLTVPSGEQAGTAF